MATTVLDSILFRDAFGTPRMREIFDDRALIARYVEVEIALARAEARCGVIPATRPRRSPPGPTRRARFRPAAAARPRSSAIRSCRWCSSSRSCAATPAATSIGARPRRTSWTPRVVLQVRDGLALVEAELATCAASSRDLARALPRHADGRPHPPAAGAAGHVRLQGRDLARHVRPPRRAARATEPRVLVGEFAGAAGTLASLGDRGSTSRRR